MLKAGADPATGEWALPLPLVLLFLLPPVPSSLAAAAASCNVCTECRVLLCESGENGIVSLEDICI